MMHTRTTAAIVAVGLAASLCACDGGSEEEPAAPTAQEEADQRQAEQGEQQEGEQQEGEPAEPTEVEELQPELKAATVELSEERPLGQFLIDSNRMSLYRFEGDEQGESTCYDECAQDWPPYLADGEVAAGEGIDSSKLSTIEREDGQEQVTYDGWPLYSFQGDEEPGDINGHGVDAHGAEWSLISPEGEKVRADEDEAE